MSNIIYDFDNLPLNVQYYLSVVRKIYLSKTNCIYMSGVKIFKQNSGIADLNEWISSLIGVFKFNLIYEFIPNSNNNTLRYKDDIYVPVFEQLPMIIKTQLLKTLKIYNSIERISFQYITGKQIFNSRKCNNIDLNKWIDKSIGYFRYNQLYQYYYFISTNKIVYNVVGHDLILQQDIYYTNI
jgi:hypothetical protein